jgi:hypothetical protein
MAKVARNYSPLIRRHDIMGGPFNHFRWVRFMPMHWLAEDGSVVVCVCVCVCVRARNAARWWCRDALRFVAWGRPVGRLRYMYVPVVAPRSVAQHAVAVITAEAGQAADKKQVSVRILRWRLGEAAGGRAGRLDLNSKMPGFSCHSRISEYGG